MANPWEALAWFGAGATAGAIAGAAAGRRWHPHVVDSMARNIQRALRRHEFVAYFQPIVDVTNAGWVGVEALIRWRTPNGLFIPPQLFIPHAEHSGLIGDITCRMVELVGASLQAVLRERPAFHVAINVPPSILAEPALAESMRRSVLAPLVRQVIIEITETGMVDEAGRQVVSAVRALGARIAIDDFGTGANGLTQLENLEIDFIKIDQGFVRKIGSNAPGAKLIDAVVTIARTIGAETIAEGIETDDQATYARAIGVDYAQGFLFSQPLPAADLLRQLPARALA